MMILAVLLSLASVVCMLVLDVYPVGFALLFAASSLLIFLSHTTGL